MSPSFKVFFVQLVFHASYWICDGQSTDVVLEQGSLVGLKVFPESARTAVYAFLGVPYAEPPTGELRFAPPKPHAGWNGTLQAKQMKPICPQPMNSIYDEAPEIGVAGNLPPDMDEDCLYLNVWVPEIGMHRYGNLPVLVIITGEQMTFDWPRNRLIGLDFASEGVVVVTLQYRSNIFGWMSLGTEELPGNYGLQDQMLALRWLQRNVQHFGGNAQQVTLLGHGTGGVPCVVAHLLDDAVAATLFSKVILMSGGDAESVLTKNAAAATYAGSRLLVEKLGCQYEVPSGEIVKCLRSKSVGDLQSAFESIYNRGNESVQLGPVLQSGTRLALSNKTWTRPLPPLLLGICSNEGAFMQDYWLDLAREGRDALREYVNCTLLPQSFSRVTQRDNDYPPLLHKFVQWNYFSDEASLKTTHLLYVIQRLLSELHYEAPFYRLLELLSASSGSDARNIYAYVFEATQAMDLRGKVNLFGGASHSSELPFLLGPSLFQQIARRRFTVAEEKLCRKMRAAFASFIKTGKPAQGLAHEVWLPYTQERKFIFSLGDSSLKRSNDVASDAAFEKNLPQIEQLIEKEKQLGTSLSRPHRNDYKPPPPPSHHTTGGGRQIIHSSGNSNHQLDYAYFLHLKRVYGFWHLILPSLAVQDTRGGDIFADEFSQEVRLREASADAQRYRKGFFALLGLTCMLLAVLGLCVYLLRRDSLRFSSTQSTRGYRL